MPSTGAHLDQARGPRRCDTVSAPSRVNQPAFERVVLSDLSHHFGRRQVLRRVSLSVGAGEIVGLLGPNGAGKSTLMSIVAGLVRPAAGAVRFLPTTDGHAKERRQLIGYLGHELALYPELSARENLRFFARLYGLGAAEDRIDAALTHALLQERGDDLIAGYSRGMRQRLALERALLHEPRLILLDEPFTGLDDAGVRLLIRRLEALASAGAAILVTTHDLDIAEAVLTRVVVLKRGSVVELEAVSGLRSAYRDHIDGAVESE